MLLLLSTFACLDDRATPFGAGGERITPVVDTDFEVPDSDSGDSGDSGDTGEADADSDADSDSDTDTDADTDVIPGGEDCAVGLGQIACDLAGKDASSTDWTLWSQYGSGPMVVSVGHAYDGNLQQISDWISGVASARSAGAAVVLVGGPETAAATAADASDWGTLYGVDPVIYGMTAADRASWMPSEQTVTYVLDADLRIQWIGYGFVGEEKVDDELKGL